MYLEHIFIKNSGAIEELNLPLQFREDGTPKPTLIVGRNGSGKSNLLSYITDALIEIAVKRFNDVAQQRHKEIVNGIVCLVVIQGV